MYLKKWHFTVYFWKLLKTKHPVTLSCLFHKMLLKERGYFGLHISKHTSLIVEPVYHFISKSPACKHTSFIPASLLLCSFPQPAQWCDLGSVCRWGPQTLEGWDFLYSKYQSSLSSTEKNQIEFALCISQNKEKLQWWVIHSWSCSQEG